MPAFTRPTRERMPSFGSPSNNGSIIGNAQGAGTVTMVLPATGATTPTGGTAFNTSGGPAPNRGIARVRTSAVGAGGTATFKMTVTDGTTTVVVYPVSVATAANDQVDISWDFNTDLGITSCTLVVVLGTAGATIDWEVSLV